MATLPRFLALLLVVTGFAGPALALYDGPVESFSGAQDARLKPGFRAACLESGKRGTATDVQGAWTTELRRNDAGLAIAVRFLADSGLTTEERGADNPFFTLDALYRDDGSSTANAHIGDLDLAANPATARRIDALLQLRIGALDAQMRAPSQLLYGVEIDDPGTGRSRDRDEARRHAFTSGVNLVEWHQRARVAGVVRLNERSAVVVNHADSGRAILGGRFLRYEAEGYRLHDRASGLIAQERRTIRYLSGDEEVRRDTVAIDCEIEAL